MSAPQQNTRPPWNIVCTGDGRSYMLDASSLERQWMDMESKSSAQTGNSKANRRIRNGPGVRLGRAVRGGKSHSPSTRHLLQRNSSATLPQRTSAPPTPNGQPHPEPAQLLAMLNMRTMDSSYSSRSNAPRDENNCMAANHPDSSAAANSSFATAEASAPQVVSGTQPAHTAATTAAPKKLSPRRSNSEDVSTRPHKSSRGRSQVKREGKRSEKRSHSKRRVPRIPITATVCKKQITAPAEDLPDVMLLPNDPSYHEVWSPLQESVLQIRRSVASVFQSNRSALRVVLELCLILFAVWAALPSTEMPSAVADSFFQTAIAGERVAIAVQTAGVPAPDIQWRLNGVDIPGATSSIYVIEKALKSHSGTYTCVVENSVGRVVWEEGYLNIVDSSTATTPRDVKSTKAWDEGLENFDSEERPWDDSRTLRARNCLIENSPPPVKAAALADSGASVIAAGEQAGYLSCFPGLLQALQDEHTKDTMKHILERVRSLHGLSFHRQRLVNVVSKLDEIALEIFHPFADGADEQHLFRLAASVAYEGGLYSSGIPENISRARLLPEAIARLIGDSVDVQRKLRSSVNASDDLV